MYSRTESVAPTLQKSQYSMGQLSADSEQDKIAIVAL